MDTYTVECLVPKGTLTAQGNVLILRSQKGTEQIIPIDSLQSIRYQPPTLMKRGCFFLEVLRTPTGMVGLGGVSVNVGNDPIRCVCKDGQAEPAEQLYQYVLGILSASSEAAPAPVSFVDELVKLKTLLDQGALTQEEFEAAKKKLLGT